MLYKSNAHLVLTPKEVAIFLHVIADMLKQDFLKEGEIIEALLPIIRSNSDEDRKTQYALIKGILKRKS